MNESKTPRTDAEAIAIPSLYGDTGFEPAPKDFTKADFARKLEIELNKAMAENATFRNAQKICSDCDAPTVERLHTLERECKELHCDGAGACGGSCLMCRLVNAQMERNQWREMAREYFKCVESCPTLFSAELCKCDHGCDGRAPLQDELCEYCKLKAKFNAMDMEVGK